VPLERAAISGAMQIVAAHHDRRRLGEGVILAMAAKLTRQPGSSITRGVQHQRHGRGQRPRNASPAWSAPKSAPPGPPGRRPSGRAYAPLLAA
jgi:hypothetical protein